MVVVQRRFSLEKCVVAGLAVLTCSFFASEAVAQDVWVPSGPSSSLGFSAFEVTARYGAGDNPVVRVDGSLDFEVTSAHGVQFDLGVVSYGDSWWGEGTVHLYMDPRPGAKYGIFVTAGDRSDSPVYSLAIGLEGAFNPTPNANVQLRAGSAWFLPGQHDYLFASLEAVVAINDQVSLTGAVNYVNFDEGIFISDEVTTGLGVEYNFPGRPLTLYAGAERSIYWGPTPYPAETRAFAGLRLRLGAPGGINVDRRSFTTVRPFEHFMAHDVLSLF